MRKLVCDRCKIELTDKYDIELALEGKTAWAAVVKAHGARPIGVLPCENYIRCGGEMKLVDDSWIVRCRRRLTKLPGQ